jgi:cytochrome c peroxidase
MSLVNVAYAASLTWVYPGVTPLEDQALVPMFGDQPIELGLARPGATLLARLRGEPRYRALFERAFGAAPEPFSIEHVSQALASFERTIISAASPYDRYHNERDTTAISPAARRGELIYFAQPFACFRCHGGVTFSGAFDFEGRRAGDGPPPAAGTFKAPTLRNIAVTAPYMHDGRAATLDEAVAHDAPSRGYRFEAAQREDLIEFLHALTDESLLHDRRFSNPWQTGSSAH